MPAKVNRILADESRRILEENRDILLLDVRQPEEYKAGHIPGAILIPLPELPDRFLDLKSSSRIMVYCRSGRRSLAAANLIADELDLEVFTIDGGILAWNGLVAEGDYETYKDLIKGLKKPEELVSLAYTLEDGSKEFYEKASNILDDTNMKDLFKRLAAFEEAHKNHIVRVWHGIVTDRRFSEFMEGGIKIQEALQKILGKRDIIEILEFSMQTEINSLDLYMKINKMVQTEAADVLNRIIEEEKGHIKKLGEQLSSFVLQK